MLRIENNIFRQSGAQDASDFELFRVGNQSSVKMRTFDLQSILKNVETSERGPIMSEVVQDNRKVTALVDVRQSERIDDTSTLDTNGAAIRRVEHEAIQIGTIRARMMQGHHRTRKYGHENEKESPNLHERTYLNVPEPTCRYLNLPEPT